jgi:hypothetical protein
MLTSSSKKEVGRADGRGASPQMIETLVDTGSRVFSLSYFGGVVRVYFTVLFAKSVPNLLALC